MVNIIKFRNLITEVLKILSPVYSVILVYFLNIMPVSFAMNLLKIKSKSNIAPTIEVTVTTVVVSSIVTLMFNKFSFKNFFMIEIYDNFRENELTLPLGMYGSKYLDKKYKLYIKIKSKYNSSSLRKFMEFQDDLFLRVCLPKWVSYEVENKDDLGEDVVIEKSKEIFYINVSKYMGDVSAQKEASFRVVLELISNSLETRTNGQVIAKYCLIKRNSSHCKIISFILTIIKFITIFLKFDIKYDDKSISTK
ncbi:hypothetical protein ACYUJ6_02145 [Clostridium sp. JNZ X4-2]